MEKTCCARDVDMCCAKIRPVIRQLSGDHGRRGIQPGVARCRVGDADVQRGQPPKRASREDIRRAEVGCRGCQAGCLRARVAIAKAGQAEYRVSDPVVALRARAGGTAEGVSPLAVELAPALRAQAPFWHQIQPKPETHGLPELLLRKILLLQI